MVGEKTQTKCNILLCWFQARKAQVDNLLPKVCDVERNHLYQRMCQLMHCIMESAFDAMCEGSCKNTKTKSECVTI